MKIFRFPGRVGSGLLVVLLVFLLGLLASPAWAVGDLVEELPGGHNTLVAIDFDQLRQSPFFAPSMEMIYQNSQVGSQVRAIEERLGISARDDVQKMVVVTDGPPLSAAMLTNPMGAFESGEIAPTGSTVFIRGRLEADQILSRMSGEEAPSAHLRLPDFDLHRVDERTLAVISGPDTYRTRANQGFSNRTGLDARFRQGLTRLGNSQGLYIMTAPNLQADAQALGPAATFAAVGVEMASEVRFVVLLTMKEEEAAKKSKEDLTNLRQQAAGNPMLGIFGLRPLVQNLAISRDKDVITLQTSMTNSEARVLLQRIVGYLNSTREMSRPLGDPTSPAPATPQISTDGVDADFN